MNKTLISIHCSRLWTACLILLFFTIQTAKGQGFFTITNHGPYYDNTLFGESQDGYTIRGTHLEYDQNSLSYRPHFGTLQLNNQGQEIAWDSITFPLLAAGESYYRIADNDLIHFTPGTDSFQIQKTRLNGDVLWNYSNPSTYAGQGSSKSIQNDQGDIFTYFVDGEYTDDQVFLANYRVIKFGTDGNALWTITQPLIDSSGGMTDLCLMPDGGCVYTFGYNTNTQYRTLLRRISASGQTLWTNDLPHAAEKAQTNSQGEIFTSSSIYGMSDSKLEKRDASGQLLWSRNLNTSFQSLIISVETLIPTLDNGALIVEWEKKQSSDEQARSYFVRFDESGNILWKKRFAFLNDLTFWVTGKAITDGGFIFTGFQFADRSLYALKLDAYGNLYPGQLSGLIAIDENVNCLVDTSEQLLANWQIQLSSSSNTFYTSTNDSGYYEITDVPGDEYQISVIPPSDVWESCMDNIALIIPETNTTTLTQDFPVQSLGDCPFMTLDIATPILRRCFDSNYNVHYCNEGSITADSVSITIVLDPFLDVNSASIPYTQSGDTLYFPLGSVASLDCGDFSFNVTVNCDAAELGQTLCVSANIYPDTFCNPPANWSGALLQGTGTCLGDSVHFQIQNVGTAPNSPGLNSYVVDEHVIMFQQQIPVLTPGGKFDVTVPANGTTWRFIAEQEPNAPGLEKPSIGVEGCGTGAPPIWGFMLQFPNRDGNPFTDQDCHEVVGSFDPNDKQAFPIGAYEQHFIEKNQPIDYQIRFQNTGTDTAFTVVVKDTLSAWLDPATIRPGAASHPYTWTLSGEGVLTFTFEHILLPDSNINEAASHGFIQFSINQKANLNEGTLLENRAGIYFDFNEPVMTNTVFHTIEYNFLPVVTVKEVKNELPLLKIWPNPAAQETTVNVNQPVTSGMHLVLRNALGQSVREVNVTDQIMKVQRKGLPGGLYFVELWNGQVLEKVGKMIWE